MIVFQQRRDGRSLKEATTMTTAAHHEAYAQALASLRRNIHPMGFTAASIRDNELTDTAENYAAIWARDSMITFLGAAASGDPTLIAAGRA